MAALLKSARETAKLSLAKEGGARREGRAHTPGAKVELDACALARLSLLRARAGSAGAASGARTHTSNGGWPAAQSVAITESLGSSRLAGATCTACSAMLGELAVFDLVVSVHAPR